MNALDIVCLMLFVNSTSLVLAIYYSNKAQNQLIDTIVRQKRENERMEQLLRLHGIKP